MDANGSHIRRPQLSDDAATYIRSQIMSGQLLAGESVRAEVVGEALDISATPAREALQALRVEGFLELLPRRGFVVAPLAAADVRDLFTAYSLIAGELAARSATARSAKDMVELESIHQDVLNAARLNDVEVLELHNHAFHRRINLIADAPKIQWVIRLMARYIPHLAYASVEGWPVATAEDHSAILDALRDRDPQRARSAMSSHILHSGDLLARRFKDPGKS